MMMTDATAEAPVTPPPAVAPVRRETLEGVWILDKNRGQWTMRGYLETLHVNELAIQAHEKGELEYDTIHGISFTENFGKLKIIKRSRVNNDLVVELTLGEESVQYLKPDDRPKKSLATSDDPGKHLKIVSSLLTMNGMAHVTDSKRLLEEGDKSVVVQELTIVNEQTGQTETTTRYFNPHFETLEPPAETPEPPVETPEPPVETSEPPAEDTAMDES